MLHCEPIYIGSRREVMWDDYLIEKTNAQLTQHKPRDCGIAMICDAPWEGNGCGYPVVIRDREVIRLYYKAGRYTFSSKTQSADSLTGPVVICQAESYDDGITFMKPKYGIHPYLGSSENNIIVIKNDEIKNTDNFAVFKDTNPDCLVDEQFKAVFDNGPVSDNSFDHVLSYAKSKDGINFTFGGDIMSGGWFDSMNCAFWDQHSRQYFLYMRDWSEGYPRPRGDRIRTKKRGIRYSVSPDFKSWSEPIRLDFGADDAIELYTNGIKPYHRSDHLFFGMPTRYIERPEWMCSFNYLPDYENRENRSHVQMRFGTALTDCVLITSRDGIHFKLWDEAFMTPGIERGNNWVYGDCYPSWGLIETPSNLPDMAPNELSFYAFENIWQKDCILRRYSIRKDGLISYKAPLKGAMLITKPFIHNGDHIMLNFATSAVGYIMVTLLDETGKEISGFRSHEIFGDSLDRPVVFPDGADVATLAGKPIRMRIDMQDADLYSFQFVTSDFKS